MSWLLVIGLSISSSIDNFGVGISYGVRGIRIGYVANLVVAAIAFVFSEAGILFGKYLTTLFPGNLSKWIGACFLLVIGLRVLVLALPRKDKRMEEPHADVKASIISTSLKRPDRADLDRSGDISYLEAIVLGIGVSLNALTNGLGAGLIGLSPLAISILAALFSFVAIWGGVMLGTKISNVKVGSWTVGEFSTVFSGIVLLIIAIHSVL